MAIKLKISSGDYSAEVEAGKTATVKCGGKKLASDIVFEAVEVADVALISFTISDTTYQAVEGMSWGEWVADTTYNTDGYYVENTHIISPNGSYIVVNQAYEYVETTYFIRADGVYLYSIGGSN